MTVKYQYINQSTLKLKIYIKTMVKESNEFKNVVFK